MARKKVSRGDKASKPKTSKPKKAASPADLETSLGYNEAADVACLVGELHLSKGEYQKAIEAFTRALEENPTADVLEGRARAYRALAAVDEEAARKMRSAST